MEFSFFGAHGPSRVPMFLVIWVYVVFVFVGFMGSLEFICFLEVLCFVSSMVSKVLSFV